MGDVLSEEETEEFIAQADLDGDGICSNLNNIIIFYLEFFILL